MGTRRQDIESAASALFSSRGYAATSMRDIARALDLQGGSLYAHIPSKEAVLWSIVEQAAAEFHAAARPIAEAPGTAAERLGALIHAHVGVVAGSIERATVFLYEWTFLGPERRAEVARSRDAYEAYFVTVIAEGMASGELAPGDPKLAATFILSAMNGMAQWYRPAGPLGADAIAERYADLFLHGLAGQNLPAAPAPSPAPAAAPSPAPATDSGGHA